MIYEKDAVQVGKSSLFWGLSFSIIMIVLDAFIFIKEEEFPTFIIFFSLFWFLICSSFISSGIKLIRSGGKWEISISPDGISWSTPNPDVDESFNFRLSEIKHIEIKKRKRRKGSRIRSYSIFLNNGAIQKLNNKSGISLAQVFIELERNGVKSIVTDDT